MKSQEAQILKYLKTGAALTPLDALEKFGCMRLASRINSLRNQNHSINTHRLKTKSGKIVASYRMAVRK